MTSNSNLIRIFAIKLKGGKIKTLMLAQWNMHETEWMFDPAIFKQISKRFFQPEIDLMASSLTIGVPQFISWKPDRGTVAVINRKVRNRIDITSLPRNFLCPQAKETAKYESFKLMLSMKQTLESSSRILSSKFILKCKYSIDTLSSIFLLPGKYI